MAKERDILKSNIIHGFGTLIAREFFLKIFSFFGQIFLARLLAPNDFGIYVIIIFIISFFSLFSDVGLSLAIIQNKQKLTHLQLSSIFNLKVVLSLFLIALIWIIAPFVKLFYTSFSFSNILMLQVISVVLLLSNIRSVSTSLLERQIKYNLISLIDVIGVFVYYIVTIFLAFLGYGAWSFILGTVIKEIVETIVLFRFQPFLPEISISKANIKKMIKFGLYIQGNSIASFIKSSVNPLIGGKIFGSYVVGLLDFAFNLSLVPETIAVNFGRVAFAGYSRIQQEKKVLTNAITKSISMLAIMLYIFPVVIFSFGHNLIPVIFSDKWVAALPALYWYSGAAFFLPIIAPLGQGILAIGKSREIFWSSLLTILLGWFGAFLLIRLFGFTGIAISYFFTNMLLCLFYIYIMAKAKYKFNMITNLKSKIFVVILTLLLSSILNDFLPSSDIFVFIKVILCALIYLMFMLIIVKDETQNLISLIIHWLNPKIT